MGVEGTLGAAILSEGARIASFRFPANATPTSSRSYCHRSKVRWIGAERSPVRPCRRSVASWARVEDRSRLFGSRGSIRWTGSTWLHPRRKSGAQTTFGRMSCWSTKLALNRRSRHRWTQIDLACLASQSARVYRLHRINHLGGLGSLPGESRRRLNRSWGVGISPISHASPSRALPLAQVHQIVLKDARFERTHVSVNRKR